MNITHRTRILVDVKLDCGCSIIYDFEHVPEESEHLENTKLPMTVPALGGGYWESILMNPGEVDDICGKLEDKCDLAGDKYAVAKVNGYFEAAEYVKGVAPTHSKEKN